MSTPINNMFDKEQIRQKRKEAYQKAKAERDADPSYQALKEEAKQARKAKYRALKNQEKMKKLEEKKQRIAKKDAALMEFFISASELEKKLHSDKRYNHTDKSG